MGATGAAGAGATAALVATGVAVAAADAPAAAAALAAPPALLSGTIFTAISDAFLRMVTLNAPLGDTKSNSTLVSCGSRRLACSGMIGPINCRISCRVRGCVDAS
jgi:hypothetical protein